MSNTPWGSPAELWREELRRLGLAGLLDVTVFCRDVGWRKPARQFFDFALQKARATPPQCVLVGDNPRWDIAGAEANGIDAVLIDRTGAARSPGENTITELHGLLGWLLPRRT